MPDAVASIANYLKKHGWKRGGAIVKKVEINQVNKIYKHDSNLSKYIPLQFTEGLKEEYFIGDDNFIAITKYNRSHFYAKAVYDLSLEFK